LKVSAFLIIYQWDMGSETTQVKGGITMAECMLTVREAAEILGTPNQYWLVQKLWRRGELRQHRISERRRMNYRSEVEKVAKQRAAKH
jgi:excisionase family DNA binding protein